MTILPNYKDIVDLIKKGSSLEAQEKIMELREAAMGLQEENLALRSRVKELEDQISLKQQIQWEKPYYWQIIGDQKDGPFCQKCYDNDRKLMRLQGGNGGKWFCHTCKGTFFDDAYRSPNPVVRRRDPDFK